MSSYFLVWSPVGNTFRPVVKCSITKQIVTDNTVIIHVVLYRPHIPGTLNGCHGLGRSILSVTLYQKVLLWPKNVRKYCLRSPKSLICSVDYDVHPYAGCAIQVASSLQSPPCCWYSFKLDLSVYWHSRRTSSSDCSASAMGGTFLQWFMWTHVALSATFSAVCVTSSTWKGPSHLFDFQLFLLWSRITTKSPGLTSCRNLSATFRWAAFTYTEIFNNRQDISLQ